AVECVRVRGRRERQARLEIRQGFAPQLVRDAKLRRGQQQRGILRAFLEPALGLAQLLAEARASHFAVDLDERRLPLAFERRAELPLGVVASPEAVERDRTPRDQ